jgi:hypothetical protein
MKITPFSPADQEYVNAAQVVDWFWKTKTKFEIHPLQWSNL